MDYSPVSLKTLKLRPGMFLQAEAVEENGRNYELQFLGMIEGKCVMVVPVGFASLKFGMQAGENYLIKGFTGLYDFHFTSSVIQAFDFTFRTPAYAYAVVSFPESVEAKKVRNAVRIKTSLTAIAIPHGSDAPQSVTLVDMSVDGALVRSASTLGAIGDLMRLDFSIGSEMEPPNLLTLARICHTHEESGAERFLTGVLFESTSGEPGVETIQIRIVETCADLAGDPHRDFTLGVTRPGLPARPPIVVRTLKANLLPLVRPHVLTRALSPVIATPKGGMVQVSDVLGANLLPNVAERVAVPALTWGIAGVTPALVSGTMDAQLVDTSDPSNPRVLDTLQAPSGFPAGSAEITKANYPGRPATISVIRNPSFQYGTKEHPSTRTFIGCFTEPGTEPRLDPARMAVFVDRGAQVDETNELDNATAF